MLTKPEHVSRAIDNAGKLLDSAYASYTANASEERKEEAFEDVVYVCRKLFSIVEYQQQQINQLNKTIRNQSSEAVNEA